jgi:hypothetical protein
VCPIDGACMRQIPAGKRADSHGEPAPRRGPHERQNWLVRPIGIAGARAAIQHHGMVTQGPLAVPDCLASPRPTETAATEFLIFRRKDFPSRVLRVRMGVRRGSAASSPGS